MRYIAIYRGKQDQELHTTKVGNNFSCQSTDVRCQRLVLQEARTVTVNGEELISIKEVLITFYTSTGFKKTPVEHKQIKGILKDLEHILLLVSQCMMNSYFLYVKPFFTTFCKANHLK